MTKRQIIDEILSLNASAEPAFLARFEDEELDRYRQRLQVLHAPPAVALTGRYERYFENVPSIAADAVRPGKKPLQLASRPRESLLSRAVAAMF